MFTDLTEKRKNRRFSYMINKVWKAMGVLGICTCLTLGVPAEAKAAEIELSKCQHGDFEGIDSPRRHQVEKKQGEAEEQRIDAVENSAVPCQRHARIFHAHIALQRGFAQVANLPDDADEERG